MRDIYGRSAITHRFFGRTRVWLAFLSLNAKRMFWSCLKKQRLRVVSSRLLGARWGVYGPVEAGKIIGLPEWRQYPSELTPPPPPPFHFAAHGFFLNSLQHEAEHLLFVTFDVFVPACLLSCQHQLYQWLNTWQKRVIIPEGSSAGGTCSNTGARSKPGKGRKKRKKKSRPVFPKELMQSSQTITPQGHHRGRDTALNRNIIDLKVL